MKRKLVVVGVVVVSLTAAAFATLRAQVSSGPVAITKSGVMVEEVKVGTSCVIVVSRADSRASGAPVAVVPCR